MEEEGVNDAAFARAVDEGWIVVNEDETFKITGEGFWFALVDMVAQEFDISLDESIEVAYHSAFARLLRICNDLLEEDANANPS